MMNYTEGSGRSGACRGSDLRQHRSNQGQTTAPGLIQPNVDKDDGVPTPNGGFHTDGSGRFPCAFALNSSFLIQNASF